jgi:hypothetical protein
MALTWTTEQILALAPDTSAAKAGRELANPRKWVTIGRNEQAAWGECKGSAATPYQTQIDLDGPAFRCSCPSRKLPCKHALGLFLLVATPTTAGGVTAPPDWVTGWLAGRARRAEGRTAKEAAGPRIVDTAAQAQRAADRQAKVATGLQDLERWLHDLVRQGLAAAQTRPAGFWDAPATRLVDAQAPGVARMVQELRGIGASGEGWQERMLEHLGRLYLLLEGFKCLDTLPADTQADIRVLIGWTQSQEEVLAGPSVHDEWLVVGQQVRSEDKMRVQRTWLWGRMSGCAALLLHFAPPGQPLDTSLVVGTALDADLVFYPGAYPLRALLKARHSPVQPLTELTGYVTIATAIAAYAGALSYYPWLDEFPLALREVIPTQDEGRWAVRDSAGTRLPLSRRFTGGWQLLALSGGHPLAVFGAWDGDYLLPLGACSGGRYIPLKSETQQP